MLHQTLREVTVEKHTQHVLFKVPAVYRTAQVIRNTPNRRVQLRTLRIAVTVFVSGSGRIRRLRRHRGGQPLISNRFYSRRNVKSSEPVRPRSYTCASAGLDAVLRGSVRSFNKPFRTRRRELFQYTGSSDPALAGSSLWNPTRLTARSHMCSTHVASGRRKVFMPPKVSRRSGGTPCTRPSRYGPRSAHAPA